MKHRVATKFYWQHKHKLSQ